MMDVYASVTKFFARNASVLLLFGILLLVFGKMGAGAFLLGVALSGYEW